MSDRKIFLSTRGKEVAWNPGEFQPAVSGDGEPEDLEHYHGRRGGVIGTTLFSPILRSGRHSWLSRKRLFRVPSKALPAEESLLVAMLGDQNGAKTCVRAKMKQMRIELGWGQSSALERILIDRIVATWLVLHFAEMVCIQ